MSKYKLNIYGKREYNLDFLDEFLTEQIVVLNDLKKIVSQKRVFNNKVDQLKKGAIKNETRRIY